MLKPFGNRILIKYLGDRDRKIGSIILPANEEVSQQPLEGEVIAIGKDKVLKNGKVIPIEVKVGDIVVFAKHHDWIDHIDREEGEALNKYLIVDYDGVIGIKDEDVAHGIRILGNRLLVTLEEEREYIHNGVIIASKTQKESQKCFTCEVKSFGNGGYDKKGNRVETCYDFKVGQKIICSQYGLQKVLMESTVQYWVVKCEEVLGIME